MSTKELDNLTFDTQHTKTPYLSERDRKQFSTVMQEALAEIVAKAVLAERERCIEIADKCYEKVIERKQYVSNWQGMADAALVIKAAIKTGE